jgi:hypothetical protein
MQVPGRERPPVLGVVYNTTLSRPDAALALALLYSHASADRQMEVGAISVTENSLGAAAFVDAVYRFYQTGRLGNGNRVLRTGLAADGDLPADSKMVQAALGRVKEDGTPAYQHAMKRISDTAEPTAQMRNAMAFFQDGWATWLLSAPATYVAKILDYQGARELIATKAKQLVIVERGDQDVAALRRLLAEWPTPIVFVPKLLGEQMLFPASAIENGFGWAAAHPVADFYRAFADMPYDAPSHDLIAAFYAAEIDPDLFAEPEPGVLEALDSGAMAFTPSPGEKFRRLAVDDGKREALLAAIVEATTAAPTPPAPRPRPPQ